METTAKTSSEFVIPRAMVQEKLIGRTRENLRPYCPPRTGHICLDKRSPVWFMRKLINLNRGPDYEKDTDEFQQYEDEANPRLPRPDGLEIRTSGIEPPQGQRKKAFGRIIAGIYCRMDGRTVGMHESTILPEIGKDH